jgi:hypothetical protein
MAVDFDFGEDAQEESSKDKLDQLKDFTDKYYNSLQEINSLEEQLKEAKDASKTVMQMQLAPLMKELQLQEFKTQYGFYIKLDETIIASIQEANKPAAFSWLRASGNDSLIRNEVKVVFGRHKDNEAKSLVSELQERGMPVEQKENVHWATLKSFVKERLESGQEIDSSITVLVEPVVKTNLDRK